MPQEVRYGLALSIKEIIAKILSRKCVKLEVHGNGDEKNVMKFLPRGDALHHAKSTNSIQKLNSALCICIAYSKNVNRLV